MKKQLQKGFTLIELMIVVAIIGILASIALPAYQDYIARSQATEGLTLMTGLKPTITEVYAYKGTFTGIDNGTNGIEAKANMAGNYVKEVTVKDGKITATFKSSGVSSSLTSKNLKLEPTDTSGIITWACSSSDIADKVLPSACR